MYANFDEPGDESGPIAELGRRCRRRARLGLLELRAAQGAVRGRGQRRLRRARPDRAPGADRRPARSDGPVHVLAAPARPRRRGARARGRPERLAQFIDVRDLAEWTVDAVERELTRRLQRHERGRPVGRAARGGERDVGLGRIPPASTRSASGWSCRSGSRRRDRELRVDVARIVAEGLRFRPLAETLAGAADGSRCRGGRADRRSARPGSSRRGARSEGRLPGPRGSAQRSRLRAALPRRRRAGPAVLRGRGRSRRVRGRRLRRAADRELGLRPGHRDARSPGGLAGLDQRADHPPHPPLPRRDRRDSARPRSASSAPTRPRSTSAGSCSGRCPQPRQSHPGRLPTRRLRSHTTAIQPRSRSPASALRR